jgi:hypothetical protein
MIRMIRAVVAAIAFAATSFAYSITVSFSTTSSQVCYGASGCGVASQAVGNVRLSFVPVASQTLSFSGFTFTSFGQLVVSCVGGGTGCANESLGPSGVRLYINITQTAPSAGNVSLAGGQFVGDISGTASTAQIQWTNIPEGQIGDVRYGGTNNPIAINSPSFNGGAVEIGALITDMTGVSVAPTLLYYPTPGDVVVAQAPMRGSPNAGSTIAISSSGATNSGSATVNNCAIAGLGGAAVNTTPANGTFNTAVASGSINATCQRNWQVTTATLTCTVTSSPGTAVQRSWPFVCPSFLTDGADVDGNGSVNTLTDGLLLARYLLGMRGSALIQGAVGPNANRSSAPLIEFYLFLLTGQ